MGKHRRHSGAFYMVGETLRMLHCLFWTQRVYARRIADDAVQVRWRRVGNMFAGMSEERRMSEWHIKQSRDDILTYCGAISVQSYAAGVGSVIVTDAARPHLRPMCSVCASRHLSLIARVWIPAPLLLNYTPTLDHMRDDSEVKRTG